MIKVTDDITINRPVDEVFDYVTDVTNLPEWQSAVHEVRTDGPITVGSTPTEVRRMLGRSMETTMEITRLEKNSQFDAKAKEGPIPLQVHYSFSGDNGSTRMHFEVEGQAEGVFNLAEPVLERVIQRQTKADNETLKDILEARSSG